VLGSRAPSAYIDEAGFVKPSLLLDGFFPVAMKKRAAIIMRSFFCRRRTD
jgi:hypothetical protein